MEKDYGFFLLSYLVTKSIYIILWMITAAASSQIFFKGEISLRFSFWTKRLILSSQKSMISGFSSIFWKSKWQASQGKFKIYWEQFWKSCWKFSQDKYNLVVIDFSSRPKVVLVFQKQNFLSFIWWIFVKGPHKFWY